MNYISFGSFRLVLWHRADIPWWFFGYYPPSSYLVCYALWVVVTMEGVSQTNHFFLICITTATNGFCSMLQATDYSIKDVVQSSVKVPEFDKTPEEGWRTYRPKRCGNNNKDYDNSPKNLYNKNQQASSQKFRQLTYDLVWLCFMTYLPL